MAGAKNLKARPKATPSRIQENISTAQAIVEKAIVANDFVHIAETQELSIADLPAGNISVPLNLWLDHKAEISARDGLTAVQIAADETAEELADDLANIDIVVLPFVSYVDGRSYSHAYKLRTRFGYKGQIRAVGDVHFDQLDFLTRSGCDAFELPEGDNLEAALNAFTEYSEVYQPSADNGRLVFARRRTVH